MNDIVNLNRFRKRNARDAKAAAAAANRVRFGRSTSELQAEHERQALLDTRHANHRIENGDET